MDIEKETQAIGIYHWYTFMVVNILIQALFIVLIVTNYYFN